MKTTNRKNLYIVIGVVSAVAQGGLIGPLTKKWGGIVFDIDYDYPFISGAAIMFLGFMIALVRVSQEPKEASSRAVSRLIGMQK